MDFDQTVEKLVTESGLSKEEVMQLINAKKTELAGLVSDLGAAHIVANELGVQTLPPLRTTYHVVDLQAGLTSIDLVARVFRVYELREFERKGVKGQVANVLIGDETGTVRLVLWGKHAAAVEQLSKNDVVQITGGYVKVDQQAKPELHTGSRTRLLINPENERAKELPMADAVKSAQPVTIPEIKEGALVRIRASILKVFQRSPFYDVCPTCGKSAGGCGHKPEKSNKALIINALLDDGEGTLRAVFFRSAAEAVLGLNQADAEKLAELGGNPLVVLTSTDKNLGKEKIFEGTVRKNKMFDRLELIVNKVEETDTQREVETLLAELETK